MEAIFTEIYNTNAWGCQETVSGPSSTLERTQELRDRLPEIFQELEIQSIIDCGCGDWNWMKTVKLTGIQYIGLEIVQPLVEILQSQFSSATVKFEKLNILQEPPETGDLWLARDLLCFFSSKEIKRFFEIFLDSKSKFLAISTVDTEQPFQGSLSGHWKPLDLFKEPFRMPEPMLEIPDGHQWFRPKKLVVFNRQQIYEWLIVRSSRLEAASQRQEDDKQDRNAHLVSNVPLSEVTLHVRKG
jgi:hypothetical protein